MVGMMRGEERCEEYGAPVAGQPMTPRGSHPVRPGEIDYVSPRVGDIHVVSNALADRPSISIHVYGANIGACAARLRRGDRRAAVGSGTTMRAAQLLGPVGRGAGGRAR
jgi:predicted metal-dependent enzyme (double-stranded beta helix superfamily)